LSVAMHGRFQRDNAAVALAATWRWAVDRGIAAGRYVRAAGRALASVRLPGRLTALPPRRDAVLWVDGGHNPEAARALALEISGSPPWGRRSRVVALWSMLSDKDASGYLRELAPCIDGVVTYPLAHYRAAAPSVLSALCRKRAVPCRTAGDFLEGCVEARRWAGSGGVVLVCGSLAAAGEAYRHRVGSIP
jgi:dihydrofolate synthase/folylpolyglutamate synthase